MRMITMDLTLREALAAATEIGGHARTSVVRRASTLVAAVAVLLFGWSLLQATAARANLQFDQVGVQLTDTPQRTLDASGNPVTRPDPNNFFATIPVYDELGTFTRQAGGHPDFTFTLSLPTDPNQVIEGK